MEEEKVIEHFTSEGSGITFHIPVKSESVWLSLQQIALLFFRDKSVISRHIKRVYEDDELDRATTVAYFATVQQEGKILKEREIEYFNLDVILSVGYKVNSRQGTKFRQWANEIIKKQLLKGSREADRQNAKSETQAEVQDELQALIMVARQANLSEAEREGITDLLERYAKTMGVLNRFDEGRLEDGGNKAPMYALETPDCLRVIKQLKAQLIIVNEASELFGRQKDNSFDGVIGAVNQTAIGEDVYPTVEQKAAHLLYFIVKNHPFNDGNKRIGAFLFAWYLERNKFHLQREDEWKVNENGLAAMALLVALSSPNDKEMIIRLIQRLVA